MHFSTSLKCASGLQEHHTEHLNGLAALILPHFFNYNTVIFDIDNEQSQTKDITYFLKHINDIHRDVSENCTISETYEWNLRMKIYHTASARI